MTSKECVDKVKEILETKFSVVGKPIVSLKKGDLVYCPYFLDGSHFKVKVDESRFIEIYDICGDLLDYGSVAKYYVQSEGERVYFDSLGLHERFGYVVFKVTPENREALNTLYFNIDFE